MRQEGEPSVEEILESIKKVIARDNRESAQVARDRRASASPVRRETAPPSPQSPVPKYDRDEEEILDLEEALTENSDESVAFDDADEAGEFGDGLTNPSSAEAMRQSLAALAMLSEPSQPPQIVRSGETSLEGLTREMLRPMLAQWLDANLPEMVETLVKAEIARIAGKKR